VNLVLLEPGECAGDARVRLSGTRATHIRQVLKAGPGQTVRLGLVNGPLGIGTVVETADDAVTLSCAFEASPPPRPCVDVLLALPRPKVMRRLWAQLAALGVGQILLTNAERVERNYFDAHVLLPATYRPLLVEGLQQARDTHVPEVSIHRQFKVLVEDHLDARCPNGQRLLAQPGAATSIEDAILPGCPERVLLAIGPEGGWNAFELRLLERHGFLSVSMGARTLRTDTACIALIARVYGRLGEVRS
jgi:16S rRNA (uracil1498-N3)-methyltransferase